MPICENLIVEETLFDRFPLKSAFDNRRWWIREQLAQIAQEGVISIAEEIVKDLAFRAPLNALELYLDDAVLHDGRWECSDDAGGRLETFVYEVPWVGDRLWDLYPRAIEYPPPGAIVGYSLLIALAGTDREAVFREADSLMNTIKGILRDQRAQIERFNRGLAAYVRAQLPRSNITFAYE